MCETAQRLVALLRMLEQGPAPFGQLGDDAMLDAWFGRRSPLFRPVDPEPGPAEHLATSV
jgi:hypothetical protein